MFIGLVLFILSCPGLVEAAVSIYRFTGRNIRDDLGLNKVEGKDAPNEEVTLPMATNVIDLILYIYIYIFIILWILAASSLLFAAYRNKATLVIPILFLIPVELTITWIPTLVNIGLMADDIKYDIVALVIISLLYLYFWICLFSFWQQLKEQALHLL